MQEPFYNNYIGTIFLRLLTLGDAPPGQCNISEERVERRGLLTAVLLPEVKGLSKPSTGPQRIVGAIIQLCKQMDKFIN